MSLTTSSFDATVGVWARSGQPSRPGRADADGPGGRWLERQGSVWAQVGTLEGHESEVKGVAWHPHGTASGAALVATCGRDRSLWMWERVDDAPGGEAGAAPDARATKNDESEDDFDRAPPGRMRGSSDDGSSTSSSDDGGAGEGGRAPPGQEWDVSWVNQQAHAADIKGVAWWEPAPDAPRMPPPPPRLLSWGYDGVCHVWAEAGQGGAGGGEWRRWRSLRGHEGTVWACVPLTGGGPGALATAGEDGTVRVWTLGDANADDVEPTAMAILRLGPRPVFALTALPAPEGATRLLAATTGDNRIVLISVGRNTAGSMSLALVAEVPAAHGPREANTAAFAPRPPPGEPGPEIAGLLATGGDDGTVRLWRVMENH